MKNNYISITLILSLLISLQTGIFPNNSVQAQIQQECDTDADCVDSNDDKTIQTILKQYCTHCHGNTDPKILNKCDNYCEDAGRVCSPDGDGTCDDKKTKLELPQILPSLQPVPPVAPVPLWPSK